MLKWTRVSSPWCGQRSGTVRMCLHEPGNKDMQGVDWENIREKARHIALQNATKHGGSARWETVMSTLMASEPGLRSVSAEAAIAIQDVVSAVNALPLEEKEKLAKSIPERTKEEPKPEKASLPPLPGAVNGKVVLRFAPFPSGSLHIGNARGVFINDEYRKRYGGKFYLVYDDTIGSEEKKPLPEGYDLIRSDMEAAGVVPDAIFYKSDRIQNHYRHVPGLLSRGSAYVCVCPSDVLRRNRENSQPCDERNKPSEWQLEAWDGMLSGRYGKGEAVVRLKTSLEHPNPAFRDRVLLRVSNDEHPRVGHKYRVWPLLEYSWAIDDVDLGITHVIRGKDLVMEDMMEEALWKELGMTGPSFAHWGMLRVREAKMSKSKSFKEVTSGLYDGWSDPRTWSFSSLARRGIRMDAVRDFVLSFGMSLADIEVPAESLYSENRRLLDPVTPRRSFAADPVSVVVEGFPGELTTATLSNHPDNTGLGKRTLSLGSGAFYLQRRDVERSLGKEIRLKELLNVELPIELTGKSLQAKFTSVPNKPLPRIQWVPVSGAREVAVLMPDGSRVIGMGESTLLNAKEGDVYQFERFGFVRRDRQKTEGPMAFAFAHT